MDALQDSPSKILVIDDCPEVHQLLASRLRDMDVVLTRALGAMEGLRLARQEPPDLILLDIRMPEMSGFEVLVRLKEHGDTHDVPVIVLSGSDQSDDKVRGFELGAVDYVTKPFDPAELRSRIRNALRMRHLVRMLGQLAHVDGLTGLWNRMHFDRRLSQCVNAARRHRTPLTLVMADVDHFKSINDRFGHPFGDQVLATAAQLLRSLARESDIVCRYGGEEFAIILPQTNLQQGVIAAERFRAALERHRWPARDELVITASFGVADLDSVANAGGDAKALLERADHTLYRVKTKGRNRVMRAAA